MGLKDTLCEMFHGKNNNRLRRVTDNIIIILVLINAVAIVLESAQLKEPIHHFIYIINYVITVVFSVEFLLRVLTFPGKLRRFFGRALTIVDIISIFPALIAFVMGYSHIHLTILRILRLTRLFRHWQTMSIFVAVFRRTYRVLLTTLALILMLCIIFSTLMFYVEHNAQPIAFANIPAAMWWCIETMTTVGYGDVVPITVLGKMIGAFVSILGIILFAVPAAILSAGFIAEFKRFSHIRSMNRSQDVQHIPTEAD